MKFVTCIPLLLALAAFTHGANYDLGTHGTLSLSLPETWTARSRNLDGKGFDLTLQPKSDANAQCKISLIYAEKKTPIDKESIRKNLLLASQKFVAGSVEKKVVLKEFTLKKAYGVYYSVTDESLVGKSPVKGNYKTMTSGMVALSDDVTAAVTILSDNFTSPEFKEMLSMVESLEIQTSEVKKGG